MVERGEAGVESVMIEAYRLDILTAAEVQQTLGLRSRWEVDALLKEAQAYLDYTECDLEQDAQTLESLGSRACL
ncbi:hypothetical protein U14_01249 [Candidatus Moduliflexus flocculans]|uniref:Uncharacterized protein n=1 Tax=Candidatus Moduliflexus flocculans TaxID=1499966 RepID=A0A0S6VRL9_9BACT|nr:hypothetical protein U14_01249 [Candidatus Moduliflexus flocculans]